MDPLVLTALVIVSVIVKWVMKKRAGSDAAEPGAESTPPPVVFRPRAAPARNPDEEKMRKFFEALGLPTDSLPPAPVAPKAPPPVPKHGSSARPPPIQSKPKFKRAPEPPPHVRPDFMPAAAESISVGAGPLAPASPVSPAEMYASMSISAPSLRPESRRDRSPAAAIALELITSPGSARRAIVLNELFSKPLSMR